MFTLSFLVGEQVDRALHLSLAALLGNDIYNFGELVGLNYVRLSFSLNPFCIDVYSLCVYCFYSDLYFFKHANNYMYMFG